MSFYYKNKDKKSKEYLDISDLLIDIVCIAQCSIVNHSVTNFYIYKNDKLYYVLKASEIDPLSGNKENWSKEQSEIGFNITLAERNPNLDVEMERLFYCACGYGRTDEQFEKGKNTFEKIELFGEYISKTNYLEQNRKYKNDYSEVIKMTYENMKVIREFGFRYINSYIPQVYYKNIIDCTDYINDSNYEIRNYIFNEYYSNYNNGKFVCIFVYRENELFGVIPLTDGSIDNYHIKLSQIIKLLLLIGVESYEICSNYDEDDSKIRELNDLTSKLNIECIGYCYSMKG